jgi:hypothetical protein
MMKIIYYGISVAGEENSLEQRHISSVEVLNERGMRTKIHKEIFSNNNVKPHFSSYHMLPLKLVQCFGLNSLRNDSSKFDNLGKGTLSIMELYSTVNYQCIILVEHYSNLTFSNLRLLFQLIIFIQVILNFLRSVDLSGLANRSVVCTCH